MAGVAFDHLSALATPELVKQAREVARLESDLKTAVRSAEAFFESGEHLLTREAYKALKSAVRARRPPAAQSDPQPEVYTTFARAAEKVAEARKSLEKMMPLAVEESRARLVHSARAALPRQLIFNPGGISELLRWLMTDEADIEGGTVTRNSRTRERDRHLLLYLQRVCAKNDSFSEFGPTSWGRASSSVAGLSLIPDPGISARETFLERWTAHSIATAMNRDPDVFRETSPRANPSGRQTNAGFLFTESGEEIVLDESEKAVLALCDGKTAVHRLGQEQVVRSLAEKKIIFCGVEVPALEPHALAVLLDDVVAWRPSSVREKWLEILQPICRLPERFASTPGTQQRLALLEESRDRLRSIGIDREEGNRHLYSARNPIGEECFRFSDFRINREILDQVAQDAAPWIDLWRDCYAFVAARVAAGLRGILTPLLGTEAAIPLPAFLRACEAARLPLQGPGLVVLAHLAFREARAAFLEVLAPHLHKAEHTLTAKECRAVRDAFDYSKFDEYTYPSADLQISARSVDAVAHGDFEWLLAELHPPVALLHHGAYWSCPDYALLHESFVSMVGDKPNVHFGFLAADMTSHTTVRIFDALPQHSYFVASQRPNPAWKCVAPAEAEVFVDEATGDVAVRERKSAKYLGSFARAWIIPLGFHPFQFSLPPHTPRLRCGRVIVQRRTWIIAHHELDAGDFTGLSSNLVLALERLRAARQLPRYIYTRPTERALRRSGAEGRDKDTKPIFVDLENYLCLEIFHRWLVKAGELEVTEMLPDPAHLCWQESDGRRTFELRTLIVPRT